MLVGHLRLVVACLYVRIYMLLFFIYKKLSLPAHSAGTAGVLLSPKVGLLTVPCGLAATVRKALSV